MRTAKTSRNLLEERFHDFFEVLGLDHVENPKSVMYYLLSDQDLEHPALSREDLAELERVCGV